MRGSGLLFCLLLLTPLATAQEPCSETDPCPIPLDMDGTSLTFDDARVYDVTAGDWFVFDAFNTDDEAHDIEIADLGISFTVEPLADARVGPYLLDAPGEYTVTDLTTGATATLRVLWEDVATSAPAGNDTPAPGALLAVVLAALVLARRR